jgi:hypothetical protein
MVVAMDRDGNRTREETRKARIIFLKQSTFVPSLTTINPPYDQIALG